MSTKEKGARGHRAYSPLAADAPDLGTEAGVELALLRYRRLVHRVAANILRDSTEAEDVTQEVFLEVHQRAHLYDPSRGSVKVWLLHYAYRRSVRRKDVLKRRAAYGAEPLESLNEGWTPQDIRRLTSQECEWVVDAAIAVLPPRQRETVELACLQGVALRDIAEHFHVSLGCARHYYFRGIGTLRKWASAQAGGSPPTMSAPGVKQ